jgi:hypothetical protein
MYCQAKLTANHINFRVKLADLFSKSLAPGCWSYGNVSEGCSPAWPGVPLNTLICCGLVKKASKNTGIILYTQYQ